MLVGVLVLAVIALAGYGVGSYVLFENISPVAADCGVRESGGFRFQENTPAGWTLANPDDVDALWPASSRTIDLAPYAMPDFQEVAVPSRDPAIGPLSAWWVAGRTADARAVVVVHGHSACKKDHVVLLPAGMLHRAGFGVLLIDLRDMGNSPHQDGRFAVGTQEYLDVLGGATGSSRCRVCPRPGWASWGPPWAQRLSPSRPVWTRRSLRPGRTPA